MWQFAQGGVDKGEDCLAAARRELQEETGVTSAQLVTEMPVWLCCACRLQPACALACG